MNIIQNEMTDNNKPQISVSDISCVSKIHNIKMFKNDSFSNLNLSKDEESQSVKEAALRPLKILDKLL